VNKLCTPIFPLIIIVVVVVVDKWPNSLIATLLLLLLFGEVHRVVRENKIVVDSFKEKPLPLATTMLRKVK
jgi:Na+/citrate or Na+/malate symporter